MSWKVIATWNWFYPDGLGLVYLLVSSLLCITRVGKARNIQLYSYVVPMTRNGGGMSRNGGGFWVEKLQGADPSFKLLVRSYAEAWVSRSDSKGRSQHTETPNSQTVEVKWSGDGKNRGSGVEWRWKNQGAGIVSREFWLKKRGVNPDLGYKESIVTYLKPRYTLLPLPIFPEARARVTRLTI